MVIGWSRPPADLAGTFRFQAFQTHYRCPPDASRGPATQAKAALLAIVGVLQRAGAVFLLSDPSQGAYAYCPTPRDGHTYIVPTFTNLGKLSRPSVLLHEAFHALDDFNQDFGNPRRDKGMVYRTLNTGIQLKNAYALSQFAVHVNVGGERILEDNE